MLKTFLIALTASIPVAAAVLSGAAAYAADPAAVKAGETSDRIVKVLTQTRSRTRRGAEQAVSDDTIKTLLSVRRRRGLNLQEKDQFYEAMRLKPQIHEPLNFAFGSSELMPETQAKLDEIGTALSHPTLAGKEIVIGGHTDRVGSEVYNIELSQRRADAVKSYLVGKFGLTEQNLIAEGFGYSELFDPAAPNAPSNRRVQIVNTSH